MPCATEPCARWFSHEGHARRGAVVEQRQRWGTPEVRDAHRALFVVRNGTVLRILSRGHGQASSAIPSRQVFRHVRGLLPTLLRMRCRSLSHPVRPPMARDRSVDETPDRRSINAYLRPRQSVARHCSRGVHYGAAHGVRRALEARDLSGLRGTAGFCLVTRQGGQQNGISGRGAMDAAWRQALRPGCAMWLDRMSVMRIPGLAECMWPPEISRTAQFGPYRRPCRRRQLPPLFLMRSG